MQILALGGVFDWPVPATGCDMANELLCPLRTNYGSLHSASILSLSLSLPSPLSLGVSQWASGFQHSSLSYRTRATTGTQPGSSCCRSSLQPGKTKARSDFLKMAIPDVRRPGLEQGRARDSPLREAPAGKKNNNNNNNNNFLLAVGKTQESFQGLGVSSCLEMEARGKVRAGLLPKHLI